MIFLPECFDYIGENREESIRLACDERSHLIDNYRSLAIKHSVWLSLGGFHERVCEMLVITNNFNPNLSFE